jgi:hypothetical protein
MLRYSANNSGYRNVRPKSRRILLLEGCRDSKQQTGMLPCAALGPAAVHVRLASCDASVISFCRGQRGHSGRVPPSGDVVVRRWTAEIQIRKPRLHVPKMCARTQASLKMRSLGLPLWLLRFFAYSANSIPRLGLCSLETLIM